MRVLRRLAVPVLSAMLCAVLLPGQVQGTHTVVVTNPTAGATVAGSVGFAVTTASTARRVNYNLDGVLVAFSKTAPFAVQWDSTSVADGVHALYARARVGTHWARSAPVNFTVDNVEDPPPPPPPSGLVRGIWTRSGDPASTFTAVEGLGFELAQVDPVAAQLDTVQAAGLGAVVWLGNYSDSCSWNWSDATVTQKVNAVKGHPSIYGYFIADEPHGAGSGQCPNSRADMLARTALLHSLDPGKPTIVSENRTADFASLAHTSDIFIAIGYPCHYGDPCSTSNIPGRVAAVEAAGITEWWGMVQSFKEPGYYRDPSPAELQVIYDQWKAAPTIDGLYTYTWGNGCCGDDTGLSELPGLWDVVRAENA